MYKRHPHFHSLSNEDAVIWKYMDIFKYLNLIETASLYFMRVDKYEDKYDGFMPELTSEKIKVMLGGVEATSEFCVALNQSYRKARSFSYTNCWTLCDHESSLMWDTYSEKRGGIAIKSTFRRLCDSIIDERDIYISPVLYDFPNIQFGNIYMPLFSKRSPFSDEKEIRLFYADPESVEPRPKDNYVNHVSIKVDLEMLIGNIYFHPACPDWIVETVSAVIAKYDEKWKPTKSTLYQ
jgi:hypothetical protein